MALDTMGGAAAQPAGTPSPDKLCRWRRRTMTRRQQQQLPGLESPLAAAALRERPGLARDPAQGLHGLGRSQA